MSLLTRRRMMMGLVDDNPTFVSSKGQKYHKYHTVEMTGDMTIKGWLNRMGLMENLKELTFTGRIYYEVTTNNVGSIINGKLIWSTYAPNLTALHIIPTNIASLSSRMFSVGHYAFSGLPKLKTLQLGGLSSDGYCYFLSGGYFRDDNNIKTIGTSAGLHLEVYRTAYHTNGGFANGTKASNTIVTCYNKDTGEVMTA